MKSLKQSRQTSTNIFTLCPEHETMPHPCLEYQPHQFKGDQEWGLKASDGTIVHQPYPISGDQEDG